MKRIIIALLLASVLPAAWADTPGKDYTAKLEVSQPNDITRRKTLTITIHYEKFQAGWIGDDYAVWGYVSQAAENSPTQLGRIIVAGCANRHGEMADTDHDGNVVSDPVTWNEAGTGLNDWLAQKMCAFGAAKEGRVTYIPFNRPTIDYNKELRL